MTNWAWIAVPALLLAGCAKKHEPEQRPRTTLHEVMKDEVDTRADDVWAVGNAHIGEDAGLDGAGMTNADWQKLASAATNLHQAALDLADLPQPLVVVKPGAKIAYEDTDWGDSAKSVQQNVDKDPQGLRDLANALARHTADLAAAADKHDAATAGKLVNQLDGVCESCHVRYWYPSQRALVEAIARTGGGASTT